MKLILIVAALAVVLCSCDECDTGETRCHGAVVELCNADRMWETVMDCGNVIPGEWYCVEADTDGDTDPATVDESAHCEQEVEE